MSDSNEIQNIPPDGLAQPMSVATFIGVIKANESPDQTPYVVIRFESPMGSYVVHLPPDLADSIGNGVLSAAQSLRSSLIVPQPVIPPNLLNPNGS